MKVMLPATDEEEPELDNVVKALVESRSRVFNRQRDRRRHMTESTSQVV